jgi:hypothetical protein
MIYTRATWKPLTVNFHKGGITPRILVVHIMQGTLDGTDAWFRNPVSQVSAHFGVRHNGQMVQWVDTDDRAWHAAAANEYAIGVEHSGFAGQSLTSHQIESTGQLLAWVHRKYPDISLWLNKRPFTGSGLSWHGLGQVQWGNHPGCPGSSIVHQLHDILDVAKTHE